MHYPTLYSLLGPSRGADEDRHDAMESCINADMLIPSHMSILVEVAGEKANQSFGVCGGMHGIVSREEPLFPV